MRNIFGWLGQQEQRKALEEATEHIRMVQETVHALQETIAALVDGNYDEVQRLYHKVTSAEHEADIIRRSLLNRLSEGLFLPPDREDLVHFVERTDDIADYACAAARLIILMDTQLPGPLNESLAREAVILTQAVDKLRTALEH